MTNFDKLHRAKAVQPSMKTALRFLYWISNS